METFLSINGINTAVTHRKGKGPVIVCIHGNSLSSDIYKKFWTAPWLSRFPMLTYDLPGHGRSSRSPVPEKTYTMSGYSTHLASLLSTLGIDEMVLFGFSFGGHIAFEAGGTGISSGIKGIYTVGSPPLDDLNDFAAAFCRLPGNSSLFSENLDEEQISTIVKNVTDDEELQRIMSRDIKISDTRTRKQLVESLYSGDFHSEFNFLRSTHIPCRITFGDNDKMVDHGYVNSRRIRDLLDSRMKIFNRCDHLPDWSRDGGFTGDFISFLERIIV